LVLTPDGFRAVFEATMARQIRVEYAGAIYHVMNRGDRGKPIFKDDRDRILFLETLGQACAD
jgi:putative transposase